MFIHVVVEEVMAMFVYLVGGVYVHPCSSGGSNNKVLYCTDPNCDKLFLSIGGRDKHILRKHRGDTRLQCRHGCGKSYMKHSDSLRHHERTCDHNPDVVHVGRGVPQQHYRTASADHHMNLVHRLMKEIFD